MIVAMVGNTMYRIHDGGKVDRVEVPPQPAPVDKKAARREAVSKAWSRITKQVEKVPWERIWKKAPDDHVIYEIRPTSSVRNNQAHVLAKVVAGFYRKPEELRTWGKPWGKGTLCTIKDPYRVNFRIVMTPKAIQFYLIMPKDKAGEILRKAEAVYDAGITITQVQALPKLLPDKTFCTELGYRRHDMFSLSTDKTNNYPLPSLLTAVRTLEGDDVAIFDAMLEPYDRMEWFKEARDAHRLLENGYIPNNGAAAKLLRLIHNGFDRARYELLEMTRITKKQKSDMRQWKRDQSTEREAARIRADMTPATKKKQDTDMVKAWLRVAVQSEDEGRAKDVAYTITNAWKDISEDNELDRFDVPKKWTAKYLDAIETRKGFSIRLRPNKMSTDEAGKLFQLPGDTLINEFPQIQAQKVKEVSVPEELTLDVKGVRIGAVTERGITKQVKLPLAAYTVGGRKIQLKEVYDSLCIATFGQGQQGSGKSEGFGTVWAYDMLRAGFSVIIIDTADGQVLRNFVDSLPGDYPDEKIHAFNFDNKAWPIPAGWEDVYGRNFTGSSGDEELAALEISERITARFIGFINSLSSTGEFSDRMSQYVTAAMRAVTTQPGWSFLDLELAITSPSYREYLLELPEVQAQPDVVRDLLILQDKAAKGSIGELVDPIMARLKVLSSTQFLSNLFYQAPKLTEDGKPVLDFRRIMDNPEGGYGHVVVIQASWDAWQEHQATILGFFDDKINFNAFSRIDQEQKDRKPVLKWIDEPHKVVKAIEGRAAGTAVEFRKYRVKQLYTGHSIDQMGSAAKSLLEGGACITSYKTKSLEDLKRFSHDFAPYTKAADLFAALPEKHVAVNKVRLPSGKDCPAFIAQMQAPPKKVKDRSYVWQQSAERYGRPWKEVRETIRSKRDQYTQQDNAWYAQILAAKEADRAAKKKKAK